MLHITWRFWLFLFTSPQTIYFLWLPPQSPSSSKPSGSTWNKCSHWLTVIITVCQRSYGRIMFSVVGVCLFVHRGMCWTSLYRDPTYTTAPQYGPGPSPTLYILMLNPRHLQQNLYGLYGLNPSVVLRMTLSPHKLQPLPPNKRFRCFLHRLWAAYPCVVQCIQGAAFYSCNCWNHTPTNRQTDAPTQEESTLVVVELT